MNYQRSEEKPFNFRSVYLIFAFCLLALGFSILGFYCSKNLFVPLLIIFCFAVVFALTVSVIKRKIKAVINLVLCILVFVSVFLNANGTVNDYKNTVSLESKIYTARVDKILAVNQTETCTNYDLFLIVDGKRAKASVVCKQDLFEGYEVYFEGKLNKIGVSDNYNYLFYLFENKTYLQVDASEVFVSNTTVKNPFKKLKNRLYNSLKYAYSDNYGTVYAMLTGSTAYIDSENLSNYRKLGIAHIFAVSGLHIGIIYWLLRLIARLLKIKKQNLFFFITPIIFLYALFCGLSSSSLRAFFILVFILFAKCFGLKYDSISSIFVSVTVTLMFSPFELFSVGFILSYSVYGSLILLTKPLIELLSKVFPEKVSSVVSPYIVSSYASMPLLVDFFDYAPIFSWLINLIFLPVLSFVYILAFISGIGLIITEKLDILAVLPNLILKIVNGIIGLMDTNSFLIKGFKFSYLTIFYYMIGLIFSRLFNFSKKSKIILEILTVFAFIFSILMTVWLDF